MSTNSSNSLNDLAEAAVHHLLMNFPPVTSIHVLSKH